MSLVEGLTVLQAPPADGRMSGSKFALPPGFNTTAYASKWVEDGPEIMEAAQPQIIQHANMSATGWAVHKVVNPALTVKANEELNKDLKPGQTPKVAPPVMQSFTRVVGKRVWVLLFRPRELQQAVNDIYARQSRALTNRELMGENDPDPGMLTNQDLRRVSTMDGDDLPTPIPNGNGQAARNPNDAAALNLQ